MKYLAIVFILFLLLSCSSENGTKPELTNPVMENDVNEDPTQRDRTWDLVIVDDDGFYLNLDVTYVNNYKIKWTGELYCPYNGTSVGLAYAYYDIAKDLFGASGIDNNYSNSGSTDCNYFFEFNGNAMNGSVFYSYNNGYAYTIVATIVSGTIGSHTSSPIAADFINEEPTPRLSAQSME
jgi:hypothetical protein